MFQSRNTKDAEGRQMDVVEGEVHEIRIAYDEYGIVGIQMAPLDDEEWSDDKAIEVLEAAVESIKEERWILLKDGQERATTIVQELLEIYRKTGQPVSNLEDRLLDIVQLLGRG